MSTQPLLNALRVAFFLGSACALFTMLRWDEIRPHVAELDAYLVERHVQGPTEALNAALAELKEGQESEGLRALSGLARELREVRLGTRLEKVRTTALDTLGAKELAAERNEAAMAWTQELLDFNPRDFPALLRRAELHRRAGDEDLELADIRAAFKVGLEKGQRLLPLVESMARRGQREELAPVLLRLVNAESFTLPANGWQFRWADGEDSKFAKVTRFTLQWDAASGLFRGEIPVRTEGAAESSPAVSPATMQKLRVDLPGSLDAELRAMRIELTTLDGSTSAVDLSNVRRVNHLNPTESGGFRATGQMDPFLVLRVSEDAPLKDVIRVAVTMDIHWLLPPVTRQLFSDGITDAERQAWTERFGKQSVSALEASLGR